MENMKKLLFTFAGIILAPAITFAATVNVGGNITVTEQPQDDLYVVGGEVQVESQIDNDLMVVGGEVDIIGNVVGDLMVVGGEINVKGNIDGDMRVTGGEVEVFGNIKEDLVIFGAGEVLISEYSEIGGDLVVNGGQVVIDGKVNGNILVNAGHVELNGAVEGGAKINGGKIALNGSIAGPAEIAAKYKITLGDKALFGSSVKYWSPKGVMDFGETSAEFVPDLGEKMEALGMHSQELKFFVMAACFLSGVLLILVLMFASNFFSTAAMQLRQKPWKSFGYGVLYFILMPVIAVLFIVTIIGIPIGLFLLFLYVFTIMFAQAISALVVASYASTCCKKRKKTCGKVKVFLMAILVFALMKLLCWVPIVGPIALIILVLFAFGAVLVQKSEVMKKII